MARPKKYTQEFLAKEAKALLAWMKAHEEHLWLGSFAAERGYSRQRLSEFAGKSEEFADAYSLAKTIQEAGIVQGGLGNRLNAKVVVFTLKNVAGWRDTKDLAARGGSVTIILEKEEATDNGNEADTQDRQENIGRDDGPCIGGGG